MSYTEWLTELGTLIRKETTATRGWKQWESWRAYYDGEHTPEEALEQSGVLERC